MDKKPADRVEKENGGDGEGERDEIIRKAFTAP